MKRDYIQLGYQLTYESLFHCGTGLRSGLTHRSIARDHEGYLYIPGSTIKGILRDRATQLAQWLEINVQEPHTQKGNLQEFARKTNVITQIFGSRYRPGTLFFDDAVMCKDDRDFYKGNYQETQLRAYTQVSMSRVTGTGQRSMLFSSEYGNRGLRFDGTISGYLSGIPTIEDANKTYSLVLLLAALCSIERIGGNKSAGAGKVTCTITHLNIKEEPSEDTSAKEPSEDTSAKEPSEDISAKEPTPNTPEIVDSCLALLPDFEYYELAEEQEKS